MRYFVAAALVAAQLCSAAAQAATLEPVEAVSARGGAFAGARLKVAFGGRDSGKLRAGLGIGPTRLALQSDGRVRTSLGDGIHLGVTGDAPIQLQLAGRSLDDIRLAADGDKRRKGVPTWAWIVGGTVVVIGIAGAVFVDYVNDQSE